MRKVDSSTYSDLSNTKRSRFPYEQIDGSVVMANGVVGPLQHCLR